MKHTLNEISGEQFWKIVVAGLIANYVMTMTGFWQSGLGLAAIDVVASVDALHILFALTLRDRLDATGRQTTGTTRRARLVGLALIPFEEHATITLTLVPGQEVGASDVW